MFGGTLTKNMNTTQITTLLLVLLVSTQVWATNGYFTHGVGVKNKALAGAGSASPSEAVVTAINPAAAVYVGKRTEFGLSVFSPTRRYKTSQSTANGQNGSFTIGPDSIESDNKSFPIPYVGKIWERGENGAIAVNFYGRGGMNTEYRGGTATLDPDGPGKAPVSTSAGTFGDGTTGVDLAQAFVDLTYARRTGTLNWGVSVVLAMQSFEARGLGNFAGFTESFARSGGTSLPDKLTDNGHDISLGYGLKLGVIWEATEALNLAVSYQSETVMQAFDRYSDLFAERGGFDVPANVRLGASWVATDHLTLHIDVDRTFFSDVGSVGNKMSSLKDCPTAGLGGDDFEACLGGNDGAGFGWEDVTVYRVGAEVHLTATPRWVWRAGYSQTKQPIGASESLFNTLAPAVVEQHFTFGASRSLDSGRTFSFSTMYAPTNTTRGANPFDLTQSIELEMRQFEMEIGLSW